MAHHRHELSDAEWALVEPLLPALQTPGRYSSDHLAVLATVASSSGCDGTTCAR